MRTRLRAWARGLAVISAVGVAVVLPAAAASAATVAPTDTTVSILAPGVATPAVAAPYDWTWT